MNLWRSVTRLFTPQPARPVHPPPDFVMEPDPEEIAVPEISAATLRTALAGDAPPLLLDIRESYEWRQVRIPAAHHIPMNEVPQRLDELAAAAEIVVICAHGSRSYGVAAYLIEQGLPATSLTGGITRWASEGGAVEMGATRMG